MWKTSLILEGGGLRGTYTAGVCDAFLDRNIQFETVAGSSAGACVGSRFVAEDRGAMKYINIHLLRGPQYSGLRQLLKTGSYLNMDYLFQDIPETLCPFPEAVYKAGKTRFYAAVTELETGRTDYLEKEAFPGTDAVRASSSLPLLAKTVVIGGNSYLDGGISDPVPYRIGFANHSRCVIVLTRPAGYVKKKQPFLWLLRRVYGKYPRFVKTIADRHTVYNRQLREIADMEADGRALVIRPTKPFHVGRISARPEDLENLYQMGYNDAMEKMDEILKFLEDSQ